MYDTTADLKVPPPDPRPHHPRPGEYWYDGYDHRLPPPRPLPPPPPPPPFPPGPHPRPPVPPVPPPCPGCPPRHDLDKYGFIPVVGGHYMTGVEGKACCPIKVTITKITSSVIYFTDAAGVEHQKSYHEFMTTSWRDKRL